MRSSNSNRCSERDNIGFAFGFGIGCGFQVGFASGLNLPPKVLYEPTKLERTFVGTSVPERARGVCPMGLGSLEKSPCRIVFFLSVAHYKVHAG